MTAITYTLGSQIIVLHAGVVIHLVSLWLQGVSISFPKFCSLAGFQGLFLFLLYVVFCSFARNEWIKLILHKGRRQHSRPYTSSNKPTHSASQPQHSQPHTSPKESTQNAAMRKPNCGKSGRFYRNAFPSKPPTSFIASLTVEEYSLSDHQATVTTLNSEMDKVEYELHQHSSVSYPNASDKEIQPAQEANDTDSLTETTFTHLTLPLKGNTQSAQSSHDENLDCSEIEASTTFINPSADEDREMSQHSSDTSDDDISP